MIEGKPFALAPRLCADWSFLSVRWPRGDDGVGVYSGSGSDGMPEAPSRAGLGIVRNSSWGRDGEWTCFAARGTGPAWE